MEFTRDYSDRHQTLAELALLNRQLRSVRACPQWIFQLNLSMIIHGVMKVQIRRRMDLYLTNICHDLKSTINRWSIANNLNQL